MSRSWKRRLLAAPVLLAAALVLVGWSLWPIRWISQPAQAFPAATGRYRVAVAGVTQAAPVGSFLHVGHRAGSFEAFARSLDAGSAQERRPVAELMDRAFDELGLNAIEVDVRASPLDPQAVVVVHDPIHAARLDDAGRAYVTRNTVRRLLERFLTQGRHRAGKRIVFEVKAPREGLDEPTRQAVDRIARTLNQVCGGRPDAARARRAVDLLSFNHAVLERLHTALGSAGAAHGLYLAVTSDQFPELLFRLAPQPAFDATLQAKLRDAGWLRGVYFDPRFVNDFARRFNGISQERRAHGRRPLELILSTFSHDLTGLAARLAAQPEPLRHVRGLIYEVRAR